MKLPILPRRLPRTWILLIGVLGSLMTLPGQTNGVSAFTDYLIDAVAIARDQLSLAYLLGTLTSALLLPHAGKLYDRWGSRVTGALSAAGLGISLFALVQLPRLIEALGGLGIPEPAAALVSFWLGFFLIRFFGQGMLTLISRNMILKWYDDRRGFAIAILGVGMPLGFSAAPTLLNQLIAAAGWQGAWVILGLLLFPLFALVALFTYSDPPLSRSREPGAGADRAAGAAGGPAGAGDEGAVRDQRNAAPIPWLLRPLARVLRRYGLRRTSEPMRPQRDRSLAEARKDLSFWVIIGVITLSAMLVTGFTFHVVAIMGQSGVARAQALAIFIPIAVIQISVQALGSIGSDFIKLKYLVIVHAAALGLMLLGLQLLQLTPVAYWLVVVFQGISLGLFGINSAVIWPRFYGLTHLGAIGGFANAWMVAGSALGPYAFSLAERLTGSFYALLYVMGPVALLLTILGFKADSPAQAGTKPGAKRPLK